jgi:hypothetical protein
MVPQPAAAQANNMAANILIMPTSPLENNLYGKGLQFNRA